MTELSVISLAKAPLLLLVVFLTQVTRNKLLADMVATSFQNYFEKCITVHYNSTKVICESYIPKHKC